MSDATTHLLLPYILAAQAQKHVTHNEALRLLDGLVQLSVLDRDLTAPPGSPADGDRYIVASGNARVTDNDAKARKLWSKAAQSWFSGGPEDENLVIIEVDVDEADWWDGMKSEKIDLG